jgi:hypothetical protein
VPSSKPSCAVGWYCSNHVQHCVVNGLGFCASDVICMFTTASVPNYPTCAMGTRSVLVKQYMHWREAVVHMHYYGITCIKYTARLATICAQHSCSCWLWYAFWLCSDQATL